MIIRFCIYILILKLALVASPSKEIKPYFYTTEIDSLSQRVHQFQIDELLEQKYIRLDADANKDYIVNDINVNDNLSASEQEILKDTAYTQLALIGAVATLWVMPTSISKWDKDEIKEESPSIKWKENIKAGPVLDEDEFFINYVGHPISGAIYYAMARNDGLDPFASFAFSFAMSTFFWEYGYESLAEIPSIQDLVSTPIVGAFLGEYMYYLEQELDKNGGLIWGYKSLGNISYAFLDPMGRLAESLSSLIDSEITMHYTTYQQSRYIAQNNYNRGLNKPNQFSAYNYGFMIDFKF